MKALIPTALLLALAAGAPAHAADELALAREKQCLQCHAVDRHLIGPSFQDIKAIYSRMDAPEARLVDVVRMGSGANLGPHWGRARMPDDSERPAISDAEARRLARWILS